MCGERWHESRTALPGMSLSDDPLAEIRQVAERPTLEDLRARLAGRTTVAPSLPLSGAVLAERDRRLAAAPGHGARVEAV